jgi:polyhydroxyalkanoate synthesis regulator phasin
VDWRQQFLSRALTWMQDPRIAKVMQDPRVVSGLTSAVRLHNELQRSIEHGVQRITESLDLASRSEVRELRRAVSRLERELERARGQRRESEEQTTS